MPLAIAHRPPTTATANLAETRPNPQVRCRLLSKFLHPGYCRMTGRPAESSGISCSRCGELLRPGDRFCAFCGTAAPLAGCERCGAPLGAADRFCPRCGTGTRFGPESQVAASATTGEEVNPWVQVAAKLRAATAGEFDILRELGRGGMAAVYLAHEVALNRKVAIKVMSPALLTGEGMVRRFRQEAETVANMSHPHISPLHADRQIKER